MGGTDIADGAEQERASIARIYDYLLGGEHHLPVDRAAAEQLLALNPGVDVLARRNRAFIRRAVRFLADTGTDQFLDLGAGIPTVGNIHDVATAARVVYVDNDDAAVRQGERVLDDVGRAAMVQADLGDSDALVAKVLETGLLDFDRPVAVVAAAVLHFFTDNDAVAALLDRYARALAPGSHLVISHATLEGLSTDRVRPSQDEYTASTGAGVRPRSRAELESLLPAGFAVVPPGIVPITRWRPDPAASSDDADASLRTDVLGLVARKG